MAVAQFVKEGHGWLRSKIAGILYIKNLRPGEEVKQLTTEGHTDG